MRIKYIALKAREAGMLHIVIPIVTIVLVGSVGTVVLARTHAATSSYCAWNTYTVANEKSTLSCVTYIQKILNATYVANPTGGLVKYQHGAKKLTVDGQYGPLTEAQVVHFQNFYASYARGADGQVGPHTWGALCYAAYHYDLAYARADYNSAACYKISWPINNR